MAHNPHLREDGKATQFKPGNPGGPGRKPAFLRKFIKSYGMSRDDVRAMTELITFTSVDRLKEIFTTDDGELNGKLPAYVAAMVAAVIKEMGDGKATTMTELRNWVYGGPAQPVDLSGSVKMMVGDEEVIEKLRKLLERQDGETSGEDGTTDR